MARTSPPPPPPSGTERRAHPRIEVLAQVQVARDAEVHIMSARNLSRSGIFLNGNPAEMPDLKVGLHVELMIFAADDAGEDVTSMAHIVRVEDGSTPGTVSGFALTFIDLDLPTVRRLERLIHRSSTLASR